MGLGKVQRSGLVTAGRDRARHPQKTVLQNCEFEARPARERHSAFGDKLLRGLPPRCGLALPPPRR